MGDVEKNARPGGGKAQTNGGLAKRWQELAECLAAAYLRKETSLPIVDSNPPSATEAAPRA